VENSHQVYDRTTATQIDLKIVNMLKQSPTGNSAADRNITSNNYCDVHATALQGLSQFMGTMTKTSVYNSPAPL
jgi:hypothetical protein